MKKKIGIVIEARSGSKRLPDKVLLKVGDVKYFRVYVQ